MVVAVIAMLVMKAAVDEIVDVIAMGDSLVPTARAVNMSGLVALMPVLGRAARGVCLADFDHMLGDAIAFGMMQVAVMEIIDVVAMAHRQMSAVRAMLMGVFRMGQMLVIAHIRLLFQVGKMSTAEAVRVFDGRAHDLEDVAIGQIVMDGLTITPPRHERGGMQHAKTRRDRTNLLAHRRGQIRHRALALGKNQERAQALGVRQGAEKVRTLLEMRLFHP